MRRDPCGEVSFTCSSWEAQRLNPTQERADTVSLRQRLKAQPSGAASISFRSQATPGGARPGHAAGGCRRKRAMSATDYAIGLDYGTNSVRTLIVNNANGREVASAVWNYEHGTQGVSLPRPQSRPAWLFCPRLPAYSVPVNENAPESAASQPLPAPLSPTPPCTIADDARIPTERRERFREVATLLGQFGQAHLDPGLTAFTLELWRRVCRRQRLDCRRGKPAIWAASVVHVIARMNFLFDRNGGGKAIPSHINATSKPPQSLLIARRLRP